jgi:long-subunit acyl-CoA synthetase (AMP-forming)
MLDCSEKDVVLSMLPLESIYGFVCSLLVPLAQGATVALSRGTRYYTEDPGFFRPTLLPVVPSLLKYLLKEQSLNKEIRSIVVGAGPCDLKDLEKVWRRGIDVRVGYGLTETAGGIALSRYGENPFAMKPGPDVKIRIAEDGEIFVRTPHMMDGYFHDAGQTQSVLRNGELATGDVGYLDENGELHIRGRKDDVIVLSNGKKYYLRDWEKDLERSLRTKVALITVDGDLELVASASELRRSEITERVKKYNERKELDRQITDVWFHPEPFPVTETGKLLRWKLKEECLEKNSAK